MADPNDPRHLALEREIIAFAELHGWIIGSATYHTVMAAPVVMALQQCWDPAALYVRGRADRVAVKENHCRLWEAKTNPGRWLRGAFEANPICHYIRLGVPCLYIYRDYRNGNGFEAAFWTTAMPQIDVVFLPDRWDAALRRYFRQQFRAIWPDVDIQSWSGVNGSCDPYVLISRESLIAAAVDWQQVFAAVPIIEPPAPAWLQTEATGAGPLDPDQIRV